MGRAWGLGFDATVMLLITMAIYNTKLADKMAESVSLMAINELIATIQILGCMHNMSKQCKVMHKPARKRRDTCISHKHVLLQRIDL